MKKIIFGGLLASLLMSATAFAGQHIHLSQDAKKLAYKPIDWSLPENSNEVITIESHDPTGSPYDVLIYVDLHYTDYPVKSFSGPARIVNCAKNPIVVKPKNTVMCKLYPDAPIMISAASEQRALGFFEVQ